MSWEARIKLAAAACMFAAIGAGAWFASNKPHQSSTAPESRPTERSTDDSDAIAPGPSESVGMGPAAQPSRAITSALPESRSGLSISGVVLDSAERPVPDAHVSAYENDRGAFHGQSRADGSFEIGGLSADEYRVSASKESYNDAVLESVGAGTRDAVLILTDMSSITGTVVDARSTTPIAAFDVVALDRPPGDESHWRRIVGSELTAWRPVEDENGAFALHNIPSNVTTAVGVRAEGYAHTYVEVASISPGDTAGPIVIALPPEARVEGQVRGPDGNAVPGAEIHFGPKPDGLELAHSDRAGFYSIDGLSEGPMQLTAAHPDFLPVTMDVALSHGSTRTVDFRLGEGGVIAGTVYLGDTPVPMQAIIASKLTVPRVNAKGMTDSDGRYIVNGLPPGVVDVIAHLSGDASATGEPMKLQRSAVVEIGETTTVDFYFVENVGRIAGTIAIEGTAPLEAVVQGTMITGAGDADVRARADEQGRYLIPDVPPGSGWLDVAATGHDGIERKRRIEFTVDEGEELTVDIEFAGGSAVFGTVSGLTGEHEGEVAVFPGEVSFDALDAQQFLALARTQVASSSIDANGNYRVEGIQSGTYTVAVFLFNVNADTGDEALANVLTDWRTVQVSGGEDVTVDLSVTLH